MMRSLALVVFGVWLVRVVRSMRREAREYALWEPYAKPLHPTGPYR